MASGRCPQKARAGAGRDKAIDDSACADDHRCWVTRALMESVEKDVILKVILDGTVLWFLRLRV